MFKIVLDAGHGGSDSGALGLKSKESNVTLNIALKTKEILEQYGLSILMTRSTDTYVDLLERSNMANQWKADYFISIHCNAFNKTAYGTETYCFDFGGKAELLSKSIQDRLVTSGLATYNRGVKKANFSVLRETNMPATLIECLFIDNPSDENILLSKINDFAYEISLGILNFLGIKEKKETTSVTFTPNAIANIPGDYLIVRQTPQNGVAEIGRVWHNEQVQILEEKDQFVKVRYLIDNTNAIKEGWVLALYIKKNELDYEKELCRILVDGKNLIALTGKTKCIDWAKANYYGKIKIQCVKDNKIVYEFENLEESKKKDDIDIQEPEELFKVKHFIIGESEITKEQFKKFFNTINKNYKLSVTIDEFVDIAFEECKIEGVRPDIMIAQSIHETSYFEYGRDALPEQNNYAGIGTTGGGVRGNYFESARIGIRAQVQHLKAYASIEPLSLECVDPRFKYVTKGCAPYLEDLGGRWADPGYDKSKYSSFADAAKNNATYGQMIYSLIERIKLVKIDPIEEPKNPIDDIVEDNIPKEEVTPDSDVIKDKENIIDIDDLLNKKKTIIDIIIEFIKKLLNALKQ